MAIEDHIFSVCEVSLIRIGGDQVVILRVAKRGKSSRFTLSHLDKIQRNSTLFDAPKGTLYYCQMVLFNSRTTFFFHRIFIMALKRTG